LLICALRDAHFVGADYFALSEGRCWQSEKKHMSKQAA
jgi:hypothetical protein